MLNPNTIMAFSVILSISFFGIGYRIGFFTLPKDSHKFGEVSWKECIDIFVLFLFMQFIFAPLFFLLLFFLMPGNGQMDDPILQGWVAVGVMVCTLAAIREFVKWSTPQLYRSFWRKKSGYNYALLAKDCTIGVLGCILCYPAVVLTADLIRLLLGFFYDLSLLQQVPIQQLKAIQNHPWLLASMAVAVVVVTPLTEEILFRGYLQQWFKRFFSRKASIFLSSAIFALFHYSYDQGVRNFEFFFALLLLSCFMGWVYERQTTLWAPYFLHMTFNSVNVLFLIFS